jgi:hypothetical protein
MAAHQKSDQRHDDLCAGGLRKTCRELVITTASGSAPIAWLGVTDEFNKGEERLANCIPSGINAPSVERLRIHVADIIELVKPSFVSSPPTEASFSSRKLLHGFSVVKLLQFVRFGLDHKRLKRESCRIVLRDRNASKTRRSYKRHPF